MDYSSMLTLGMISGGMAVTGDQSLQTPDTGGVSFGDVLKQLAFSKTGAPVSVSAVTGAKASVSENIPVTVSASDPIIAAVKELQSADKKTLHALDLLAKATGGSIDLESLTDEEIELLLAPEELNAGILEKLQKLLALFKAAGADEITPETVFIDPKLAEDAVVNAKESLAEIAAKLFPGLYEKAEDAVGDAENFPVDVKLIPLVVVTEKGVSIEIPELEGKTDGETKVLTTDEILETDKILDGLDQETLTRIQNLLEQSNVSILEAVKALAAVPASATQETPGGILGITVTEADFMTADMVLTRIAANNPMPQTAEEIALSDENKRVLEELQNIVKEVIIKETPAPVITVSVDPLFEARFRQRINKLYEAAEGAEITGETEGDISAGTRTDIQADTAADVSKSYSPELSGKADTEVDFEAAREAFLTRLRQSGNAANEAAAISSAGGRQPVPIDEIATQPSPFISTGSQIPPEMQIGNRIIDMKAANSNSGDGVQEMTVVLKPAELGEVAVKIVTENGAVSVTLTAANPETAKMLDRGAALLQSQLGQGGINVKEVLTIAPADASENMGLNFADGGFTAGRQGQGGQGQGGQGPAGLHHELGEEPLPGEIDGQFTPDDFMQRRMRLWQSA
jgi:flagellar hook-length control protein FliK